MSSDAVHVAGRGLRGARRRGFTLIEAAMTTAIIGIAFASVLELFAACTKQNRVAADTTVAMMLAQHAQEMMIGLPFTDPNPLSATFGAEAGETIATFDDVDDFHNLTFNPPIDAGRNDIEALSQYSQTITVANANPAQPSAAGAAGGAVRVRVVVSYQATPDAPVQPVYAYSWLKMNQ
jgi:MSHA pilin protein MshD